MTARTLLQAALDYAVRLALPIFPCIPGDKNPAFKGGFYNATLNPATITRWWTARDYNIAVRTGMASGVWVLDSDPEKGGEINIRNLEARHGTLPPSWAAISGGGGRHDWFKYLGPIPSSAGKIASGLDVRADGGYIIVPPSVHPNGRAYAWSADSTESLAAAPDWLIHLARKKPEPSISERALATMRGPLQHNGSPDAYGRAALESEISALANTLPGTRNHALNRAAFSLFQLVAAGELDGAEVRQRLLGAATANGLMSDPLDGPRSVMRTIASGARAGLQHPRNRRGAP